MYYAQLNDGNICIGVQESPSLQPSEKLIQIENYDEDLLRRKYEDGVWSEEKFPPFPQPSPQEQIAMLELALAESEEARLQSELDIQLAIAELAEEVI